MTNSNNFLGEGKETNTHVTSKYSASLIEEIIDALDIREVIEEEYSLVFEEPNAAGWWHTNCPLPGHRDSTPSFGVNPELKMYKCFGCQERGNLINFIRIVDGLSFNEAVEKLSLLAGVDIANSNLSAYRALRDIDTTVKAFLSNQYSSKLPAGITPIEYMRNIAERLRAYEFKVNFDKIELAWVDSIYKEIDAKDIKDDQKGMSQIWSSLTKEMKERYAKYQERMIPNE